MNQVQKIKGATQPSLSRGDARRRYLTFLLGNRLLGIQVLDIQEILHHQESTRVPKTPAIFDGVINLRGEVVTVIDLHRRLFNTASPNESRRRSVVIVEVSSGDRPFRLGLIVDVVSDVQYLAPEDTSETPHIGAKMRPEFIAGIGKVDSELCILLNLKKICDPADLESLLKGRLQSSAGSVD